MVLGSGRRPDTPVAKLEKDGEISDQVDLIFNSQNSRCISLGDHGCQNDP